MPTNNDSTKEKTNVNSPLNAVLRQTAIATVENTNTQCKARSLFDKHPQSLHITLLLRERLNLKTIAPIDVTMKAFDN